ncbi:hypothetical protein [Streptomyces sp. NPDC001108]
MSTHTLYGRRMRAARAFRMGHGPIGAWPADRIEVYLDLVAGARAARWHHLRTAARRARVLALAIYIAPVYVLAALAGARHGELWWRLEAHLREADGRLTDALVERDRAGDHTITTLITRVTDRLTGLVARVTDRLARI